jgi:hypothetical protein
MPDKIETNTEDLVKELQRAVNTQAKLLAAIVQAADHIVKNYVELTQPKKADVVEAEVIPNEEKENK